MNVSHCITGARALAQACALSFLALASAGAQASASTAGAPSSKALRTLSAAQKADIDAYVERAMREWGDVPGVSVAIVIGDSAVYTKGYGVRELGKPDLVDAQTVFAIGSNTKSMTSAVVGTLVDEGKMRWDAPVWTYLPAFRLADPYVTKEATMRDLLSHRVDVENNIAAWYRSALTRTQLLERVRFLRQEASFRSAFMYNNLMYMTAGEAAAAVTGKTWNALVRERLFVPMGMRSSYTSIHELPAQANIATPHMSFEGKLVAIKHVDADNIGPAGSVYSNAVDMAQYLRMQLGNGTLGGTRVLSPAAMAQIRSLTTPIGGWQPVVADSDVVVHGYGLGWLLESFRGHRRVRHNGSIDGFIAEMQLLPDDGIGVVVLSNQMTRYVHENVANHVLDVVLGLKARDWHGETRTRALATDKAAAARVTPRPANAVPTLPLAQYAGTYSDSLRGTIVVALDKDRLTLSYHPGLTAVMEPWQQNTFGLKWQTPNVYATAGAGPFLVTFEVDAVGRPVSVTGNLIGTFRAVAPRPARATGTPPSGLD